MTTAKTETESANAGKTEFFPGLRSLGQDAWWVGLGVIRTVEEKSSGWLNELRAKGRGFSDRERTPVETTLSRAAETVRDCGRKVESGVKGTTSSLLNRFGIPTHEQVSELIERVDRLNEKVDKIGA